MRSTKKIKAYILNYNPAKFHAFSTMCTIVTKIRLTSIEFKVGFVTRSAETCVSLKSKIFGFFTTFQKNEFNSLAILISCVMILSFSTNVTYSWD